MNKLEFPQALVDRMMQRRGRLHMFETLDAKNTALLVVDLQVHFMITSSMRRTIARDRRGSTKYRYMIIVCAGIMGGWGENLKIRA